MRKTVALLSLLSLFLISASLAGAQTRPRRVGQSGTPQQTNTQTAPDVAPTSTTTARRPPILGGSNDNAAKNPTTGAQPQPADVDEKAEVDEGDVVRVNTTLVTVPVSVTDRSGRYIPDLRKD